jgi:lipoate-protein ligase A
VTVIPSGKASPARTEESPIISETSRDVSTSLDMTKGLFASLNVHQDIPSRSAALNMAIDEALLEQATAPSIRFYKWDHPALSFGYFGKFADVENHAPQRDLARRWTGGGIVFHGDDLTYSIVIPATEPAFSESSRSIYERIHNALRDALVSEGRDAVVAAVADRGSGVSDADCNGHCFANPVRADVLSNGRKIAGAAQRRTRRGLLQQGSIQGIQLANKFADQFANELCSERYHKTLDEHLIARAREIAEKKYGAASWLQRR